MKDLLKTGQVLGRSEMKKIMAGSSCTNGYYCYNPDRVYCEKPVGQNPPGGCTAWGHYPECPC